MAAARIAFASAIWLLWAGFAGALIAKRQWRDLRMLAMGTALGWPAEMIGLRIGAFRYQGPTLPNVFVLGSPVWGGPGWGAALTALYVGARALRRKAGLPSNLLFDALAAAILAIPTILPGEWIATRLGVWRWDHPERLPLALFSKRLGIPLGTFAPPALMAVGLSRLAGAQDDERDRR